jgi:GTPase SAR1 family protein
MIGARACGKTTYMVALADWHQLRRDPITLVEPRSEDSQELIEKARNILEQGASLSPTSWDQENHLPIYSFRIEIKPNLWLNPIAWIFRKRTRIDLALQDYAGEFLSELARGVFNGTLASYLDSCAIASGLLFMIDSSCSPSRDREYATAVANLQREINIRLGKGNRRKAEYRIAFVMSKIEQPDAFLYRDQPEQLMFRKFPRTGNAIKAWREAGYQVAYFACSAFGVYGNPARPNAIPQYGEMFVIEKPTAWKPVGLYAPVYWLCTGKNDRRLRKI